MGNSAVTSGDTIWKSSPPRSMKLVRNDSCRLATSSIAARIASASSLPFSDMAACILRLGDCPVKCCTYQYRS